MGVFYGVESNCKQSFLAIFGLSLFSYIWNNNKTRWTQVTQNSDLLQTITKLKIAMIRYYSRKLSFTQSRLLMYKWSRYHEGIHESLESLQFIEALMYMALHQICLLQDLCLGCCRADYHEYKSRDWTQYPFPICIICLPKGGWIYVVAVRYTSMIS